MKHIFSIFLILCILTSAFSATDNDFQSISMQPMGPENDAVYDVYTIGNGTQSYTATRWITKFEINRYETTYRLWYDTKLIAEELGFKFMHPGKEGSFGKAGAEPTDENEFQPVTMISWYDAVIWLNALSEIHGYTPCYTYKDKILKDANDTAKIDLMECDFQADGYRLPTESEWEYAARKTKTGFQYGDLVSGQVDENGNQDDSIPEEELSWTALNADRTHIVGTAGTPFHELTQPSPGSGNPNGSFIFDMSGNVLEMCWDWKANYTEVEPGHNATGPDFGTERIYRGGSWSDYTPFCTAGDRYSYNPNEYYDFFGFRFCRTLQQFP